MIHFFALRRKPFKEFVDSWAPGLRPHVRMSSYPRLPLPRSWPPGAYIFADFERLLPGRFSRIRKLSERVRKASGSHSVLNDPGRYLSRFQLLKMLRARGVNDFQVYRVNELESGLKYPVFLRSDLDHDGAMTGLLHSRREIEQALSRLSLRHYFRRKHLMIVEYSEGADADGVFRKYSAMNVNGSIIPRHVLFSRNWVTKKPDLVTVATVEEEAQFLEQFPHREQLAEIFRLSGVDYGRIDYGVMNGRLQVWEINTNPVVVPRRGILDARRLPSQSRSAQLIAEALQAIAR